MNFDNNDDYYEQQNIYKSRGKARQNLKNKDRNKKKEKKKYIETKLNEETAVNKVFKVGGQNGVYGPDYNVKAKRGGGSKNEIGNRQKSTKNRRVSVENTSAKKSACRFDGRYNSPESNRQTANYPAAKNEIKQEIEDYNETKQLEEFEEARLTKNMYDNFAEEKSNKISKKRQRTLSQISSSSSGTADGDFEESGENEIAEIKAEYQNNMDGMNKDEIISEIEQTAMGLTECLSTTTNDDENDGNSLSEGFMRVELSDINNQIDEGLPMADWEMVDREEI